MHRNGRIRSVCVATACVASLVLLPCCSQSLRSPEPDPLDMDEYPQVVATENLHRVIVISDVAKGESRPLNLTLAIRNVDDDERSIQYRFFFLDLNNVPEVLDPDWHYLRLPALTGVFIQGNAMDTRAVDWRLEIRPAR